MRRHTFGNLSSGPPNTILTMEQHDPKTDNRDELCKRILSAGGSLRSDEDILHFLLSAPSLRRAQQLSRMLLARFGDLSHVISAPVWDLLSIDGLGAQGAALIKSMQLIALRIERADLIDKPVLTQWDRLQCYLHAELSREPIEQLRALFLDTRGRLIVDELVAYGTVDCVHAHPRRIAEIALERSAVALVLVQNKTDGVPNPTPHDVDLSFEIGRAVLALSITLVDHIIVGNGRLLSFKQEGLLGKCTKEGKRHTSGMPILGQVSDSVAPVCQLPLKAPPAAGEASQQRYKAVQPRR